MDASSSIVKKTFNGKKKSNAVYGEKGRGRNDRNQYVRAMLISNFAPVQQHQQGNQRRSDASRRQFTKINMPSSQALQHLLKAELITLRDPPQNLKTLSPRYHPYVKCAYHSNSLRHDTNGCSALKNKIQDLIDKGVLEFTQDGQIEFLFHPSKAHHLK